MRLIVGFYISIVSDDEVAIFCLTQKMHWTHGCFTMNINASDTARANRPVAQTLQSKRCVRSLMDGL